MLTRSSSPDPFLPSSFRATIVRIVRCRALYPSDKFSAFRKCYDYDLSLVDSCFLRAVVCNLRNANTMAMNLATVTATERDHPLGADFSPQCAALRKAQMMSIGRCAAADDAWLGRDKAAMILVANAPRLRIGKFALVDRL